MFTVHFICFAETQVKSIRDISVHKMCSNIINLNNNSTSFVILTFSDMGISILQKLEGVN